MEEKKKEIILFEDEWCKVSRKDIIIKWFYFPTTQEKKINGQKIKGIYYKTQAENVSFTTSKTWGMSLSPCWWSCDSGRQFRGVESALQHFNVVIDCGERTYKGFTTKDIIALISALRQIIPRDATIKNELPF